MHMCVCVVETDITNAERSCVIELVVGSQERFKPVFGIFFLVSESDT